MTQTTLYERLGGEAGLMAAVDLFYEKVLEDPVTKPFFIGLDMKSQVRKQLAFMARVMGGPDEYKGRDLRQAHSSLVAKGLGDQHFDAVAEHLRKTLTELGAEAGAIGEVMTIVESTRKDVLGR